MSTPVTKSTSKKGDSSQKVTVPSSSAGNTAASTSTGSATQPGSASATQKWYKTLGTFESRVPATRGVQHSANTTQIAVNVPVATAPTLASSTTEVSTKQHSTSKSNNNSTKQHSSSKSRSKSDSSKQTSSRGVSEVIPALTATAPVVAAVVPVVAAAVPVVAPKTRHSSKNKSSSKSKSKKHSRKDEKKTAPSKGEKSRNVELVANKGEKNTKGDKTKKDDRSRKREAINKCDVDSSCSSSSSSCSRSSRSSSCSSSSSSSSSSCSRSSSPSSCSSRSSKTSCSKSSKSSESCSSVSSSSCSDGDQSCTDCPNQGDLCRPLTLGDLFAVWQSKRAGDEARRTAKEILREVPCLPSCIGQKFWPEFDSNPVIGECPGEHQHKFCAVTQYCADDDGVKLEEFHFKIADLPHRGASCGGSTSAVVVPTPFIWPFGCCCVPAPLKICEEAKFTIYAFKRRHHHKRDSDCSSSDGDGVSRTKGDGEEDSSELSRLIKWCNHMEDSGSDIASGLLTAALASLESADSGGKLDKKTSSKVSAAISFLRGKQGGFAAKGDRVKASAPRYGAHDSCNRCRKPRDKCRCRVPAVPDCPINVYHCTGTWHCEVVDCCPKGCCSTVDYDAKKCGKCVRYWIEINSLSFTHEDGSELCEGYSFFTCDRFSHLIVDMSEQCLPFMSGCEDKEEPWDDGNCDCGQTQTGGPF